MAIDNMFQEDEIDPITGLPIAMSAPQAPQLGEQPDIASMAGPEQVGEKIDIKDYLMKKYKIGEQKEASPSGDKFSDEARASLVDKSKVGMGEGLVAALAAIGAGYQGKDAGAAGMGSLQAMKQGKGRALEEFDKGRVSAREDVKAKREDLTFADSERIKQESRDPMSERSKVAQQNLIDMGMDPALASNITAEQALERAPFLKQKFDRQMQEREMKLKEREVGMRESASKGEDASFKRLPEDQKELVKSLAKDNASKIAITNSIDSVLDKWDSLTPEQQLQQGRQLIKTLNSTQGKDAVGAEESKRLAGKLEFAMGNFSNDNPTQFGRDLEGFKEDARITSQAIKDAYAANQKTIDTSLGRQGSPNQGGQEQTKVVGGKTYKKVAGGWEEQ